MKLSMHQEWIPFLPLPLPLSTLQLLQAPLSIDMPKELEMSLEVITWDSMSSLAFLYLSLNYPIS